MSLDGTSADVASELAAQELRAGEPRWRCVCDICATAAASEPDYFTMAFGDPRHFAATSEDLADAFGLCQRHGAALMSDERRLRSAARMLEAVLPRVLPLLMAHRFGDEKFQQVYFSASLACPACAYERRAVGRHAGRLARVLVQAADAGEAPELDALCVQHFPLVARGFKPELRMPALSRFADALETSARALGAPFNGIARSGEACAERTALDHALSLVAGPASTVEANESPRAHDTVQGPAGFEESLGCATACPVCREVERARQRWLAAVPLAAAHGLDGWLFFPTCSEHVAAVAGIGDAALTSAVCIHALHVAAEHAHRQLQALVRAAESEAEQAAARIARWGRRPRRRKSDPPKPPPPRMVRCAACERTAVAELQATARLLRLLQGDKQRRLLESGYGLCMKHHAQAYLLSPKGAVRALLANDQRRRLSEALCWLRGRRTGATRGGAGVASSVVYDLAWRRFCGFG